MKNSTTAERLSFIMKSRSLRQADVLNLIKPYCTKYNVKLGKSALSQYISGKVTPKQDKIFVIAVALNVSEAWLMGYDVPMKRTSDSDGNTDNEKKTAINKLSLSPEHQDLIASVSKLSQDDVKKTLEYIEFLRSKQN